MYKAVHSALRTKFHISKYIGSAYKISINLVFFFKFRMIKFWDYGYTWYWKNKYLPIAPECRVDVPLEGKMKPLTRTDLSFTFLILGVGISLSFLTFLIENLYKRLFSI